MSLVSAINSPFHVKKSNQPSECLIPTISWLHNLSSINTVVCSSSNIFTLNHVDLKFLMQDSDKKQEFYDKEFIGFDRLGSGSEGDQCGGSWRDACNWGVRIQGSLSWFLGWSH